MAGWCPLDEDGWDVLVLLDACRFDYFSVFYSLFFSGRLEERVAPYTCTHDYCVECIMSRRRGDVVYVSANPYISSRPGRGSGRCRASGYLGRVVDVWLWGWDDGLGTVPPEAVVEAAVEAYASMGGRGRLVVHFVQPHAPYLLDESGAGFPSPRRGPVFFGLAGGGQRRLPAGLEKRLVDAASLANRFLPGVYSWLLSFRRVLGLAPLDPVDDALRRVGRWGLQRLYALNLLVGLAHAALLTRRLWGRRPGARIVVSSDHGELLGERGMYGHPCGFPAEELRRVPWLVVEGVRSGAAARFVLRYRLRVRGRRGGVVAGLAKRNSLNPPRRLSLSRPGLS